MSDKFYTLPIERLAQWIKAEESEGKIFGLYKENLYKPRKKNPFKLLRYGQILGSPIGVAAGPHTQLAQNIIASWLSGARYIELKTIQTLDELDVVKPCIDMEDEGYNCEWSQELKIQNSFDEYLNAWILIHLLKSKFGHDGIEDGFIFNISIGYNLDGILKPNVQWFFDKIKNCKEEKEEKLDKISKYFPEIHNLDIPNQISNNVTLSTMHGCPSDEIENIGKYLIEEKKLHTSIKINPTLLGPERLRFILNDKLRYKINVPEEAFEHDLKFDDAVRMVESLSAAAEKCNVEFGLKLTNTLESLNSTNWLPKTEKMVYTSGRALHPISVNLAEKLQSYFAGSLDISFSAGVDAFNISDTLACNLKPVTICSDILKPGGYLRLIQYFDELQKNFTLHNVNNIDDFIRKVGDNADVETAGLKNLRRYSIKVLEQKRYYKSAFPYKNIKTNRELNGYDCIYAPCIEECAVSQDVPEYMYHTAIGDFSEAYRIILKDNPLPNITGNVCDHLCQVKCTRINYDNPLLIRAIKRFNAEKFEGKLNLAIKENKGLKAAVLGAGPSGLSCAYFLALEGFNVELYESKSFAGGMASDSIPRFRLSDEQIMKDVEIIKSLGVKFNFNASVDKKLFEKILSENEYIYIGIGAQKSKKLNIPGENLSNIYDQLTYLSNIRRNNNAELGKNIAIIGGGNSAVDAARTAKRLSGKSGNVTVIYRRTINEMPADPEEISALLDERINILELTSPTEFRDNDGTIDLHCVRMKLGDVDKSGRRLPEVIPESDFILNFDSIITAIGQETDLSFLDPEKLVVGKNNETQFKNVFAGGDATRGADSLINAIADGKNAASVIIEKSNMHFAKNDAGTQNKLTYAEFQKKQAKRVYGKRMPEISLDQRTDFSLVHPGLKTEDAIKEAERCLYCNDLCNICIGVCPNFSNFAFEAEKAIIPIYSITKDTGFSAEITDYFEAEQENQILNIGDFCNECGNCNTFCPTNGAPYIKKPRFYLTSKSFDSEDNCFYIEENIIKYKNKGEMEYLSTSNGSYLYRNSIIKVEFESISYKILDIEFLTDEKIETKLSRAAEMIYLLNNLNGKSVFKFKDN